MRSEPGQKKSLGLALILGFLCAGPIMQGTASAKESPTAIRAEYEVKAAFVHNFVKFVEWPVVARAAGDTIRLCVLGDLPDASAFANLDGRLVMGKRMTVLALRGTSEVRTCDVLFVATNQTGRLQEVLGSLEERPVLTIGDTEGYARRGIMINMFLENKRVRFEINEEKARAAGLRISAKLLKLASKVYGAVQSGEE